MIRHYVRQITPGNQPAKVTEVMELVGVKPCGSWNCGGIRQLPTARCRTSLSIWQLALSIWSRGGGGWVKDFRGLKVWEKAHRLTLEVYKVTRRFPREELYGLTSQMRRCGTSIAAN